MSMGWRPLNMGEKLGEAQVLSGVKALLLIVELSDAS